MTRVRGFELVSKYVGKKLTLPERATVASAGYDLAAAKNMIIPSIWTFIQNGDISKEKIAVQLSVLVPTGIKAYMPESEYLMLVNRSSNPLKNNLAIPNGIGIIDSDYYNNPNNEGEIFVQLINYGLNDYEIKKGDRIAQGIFTPYYTVDKEQNLFDKRLGGFGSTGKS